MLHLKRLVGGLTAELLGLAVGWDSEAVGFDGELYGQGVYQLSTADDHVMLTVPPYSLNIVTIKTS